MWTEAHRARHQAGLKERASTCAVEEMARWLERADPPRSEKATPVLPVVSAIAWHLRVGGPWRALPGDFPAWQNRLKMVCLQATSSASSGTAG